MTRQAIARANGHDTSTRTANSPLRRLRQRRGLTQVVLADRSGLSASFLSMVENGQRELSRRDHVNALATALRVAPSELAPSTFPELGEWAPSAAPVASKFPAIRDDITMARHKIFAEALMSYVARGDGHAAGTLLRRMARDHTVSPWLLLDELAVREIGMRGFAPTPDRQW